VLTGWLSWDGVRGRLLVATGNFVGFGVDALAGSRIGISIAASRRATLALDENGLGLRATWKENRSANITLTVPIIVANQEWLNALRLHLLEVLSTGAF
jgi:hypothetical protein